MSIYKPEKWIVLLVTLKDETKVFKLFATWSGNFSQGESWRLNSGITKVRKKEDIYIFEGVSGSEYHVNQDNYGTSFYGQSILEYWKNESKMPGAQTSFAVMPINTDWLDLPL